MEPWKMASRPEEAGISSQGILDYLDAVEASGIEHHSILVLRNGMLACKMNFAPYDDQTPHVMFSMSKSFTSAAAGFAVQEGLLSWDSRVIDVLADKALAQPSEWLQKVTLHHLLCMGSGLNPKSDAGVIKCTADDSDWAQKVLAWDCDAEPGTRFHYNSHGTYLISAMVQRVAGMNIRDYLMPRLFEPLGIPKLEWDMSPQGICVGGWGLHVSSDSLLRFGLCLLQKGQWEGRQVLPLEWLEKATVKQIDNATGDGPQGEWGQGYGYQFWRTRGNRFRGDGMRGQVCMVSPDQNMVVAITAGVSDMGKELELLHKYLFPAANMPPAPVEKQKKLQERLSQLSYPWPVHDDDASELADAYEGEGVRMEMGALGVQLQLEEKTLFFGWGEPVEAVEEHFYRASPPLTMQLCAGWKDGQLDLLMRVLRGPFMLRCTAVPNADGMHLKTSGLSFPTLDVQLKRV